MEHDDIVEIIKRRLGETGRTAGEVSRAATGGKHVILQMFRGHKPSSDRLAAICKELGLDFYIGPPRTPDSLNNSRTYSEIAEALGLSETASVEEIVAAIEDLIARLAEGSALATRDDVSELHTDLARLRETLLTELRAEFRESKQVLTRLPETLASTISDDPQAVLPSDEDEGSAPSVARPVNVMELAAAAGSGAEALDETPVGQVWFRRNWLDSHALDPAQCNVISVSGESMDPLLPDGCSILVDRARRQRRSGRVFVLRTAEGVVVKRLMRESRVWHLVSEHPQWPDQAWTDGDVEVIGEVRWMARSL